MAGWIRAAPALRGLFIEVIVCSVADAVEAERGGADRLEVARAMDQSGLTPPMGMVREIQRAVRLPLRVMVRERDDFHCDRPAELDRLCDTASELDAIGVDGIVVGFERDGAVDVAPLERILRSAPGVRATSIGRSTRPWIRWPRSTPSSGTPRSIACSAAAARGHGTSAVSGSRPWPLARIPASPYCREAG